MEMYKSEFAHSIEKHLKSQSFKLKQKTNTLYKKKVIQEVNPIFFCQKEKEYPSEP